MNLNAITKVGRKILTKLDKHSPEILVVTGIACVVTSVVTACVATTHLEEAIEETHADLDKVDLHVKPRKIDYLKAYIRGGWRFVKLYGPSGALLIVGVVCIGRGHVILKGRYLGATAACTSLQEAYNRYRQNVREEFGEEAEKNVYNGLTKDGKPKEDGGVVLSPTKGVIVNPGIHGSPYAVFFDESSTRWSKNAEFNKLTLSMLQEYANQLYNQQGHMFLNEVYDMLGVPRTQAGTVVGWIKGAGDDYIDFGIDNPLNEKARDFVNGYERSILLDFNVDGLIYDKI